MRRLVPFVLGFLLATSLHAQSDAFATPAAGPKVKLPVSRIPPTVPLTPRERAQQLLSRFTFGARPGDLERVLAAGPDAWFDQQLTPGSVTDAALDKRLRDYPTLSMTPEQAELNFPDRGVVTQVADGKRPMPSDPLLISVYEVQVERLKRERAVKTEGAPEPSDAEKAATKAADQATAARIAGQLFALPKGQRMAALNAMPVGDRMVFANNLQGDQRNTLMADFTPREREALQAMQGGVGAQGHLLDELAQAHVLRQILTERQVQEVMTDFWFNHFNVFFNKDADVWYTTAYERDTIRPHALGKFRDLLLATAESPAMMVYLDNWLSIGPNSLANGVNPANPNSKPGKKGLNENYGREVMELHTLGVAGGYTQADVTHLSAILTGWSVNQPNQAGPFQFDPKKHEPGTKQWFGYTIDEQGKVTGAPVANADVLQRIAPVLAAQAAAPAADGMRQGMTALTILAASPQTAHFISYLIAQRFLADDPPAPVVDRMAKVYLGSDGDIKTVLHTLVASPEFNSRRYFRTKVKTPSEFFASAFRATLTDPQNPGAIVNQLRANGQPPYQALPPTGYYITADHWMNTGALVDRLNFADQLTHNRFANQKFDSSRVLAFGLMTSRSPAAAPTGKVKAMPVSASAMDATTMGPDVALKVLESTLIGGEVSPKTDQFIHGQLTEQPPTNPGDTLNLLTALLLGSPEFQLR